MPPVTSRSYFSLESAPPGSDIKVNWTIVIICGSLALSVLSFSIFQAIMRRLFRDPRTRHVWRWLIGREEVGVLTDLDEAGGGGGGTVHMTAAHGPAAIGAHSAAHYNHAGRSVAAQAATHAAAAQAAAEAAAQQHALLDPKQVALLEQEYDRGLERAERLRKATAALEDEVEVRTSKQGSQTALPCARREFACSACVVVLAPVPPVAQPAARHDD